MELVENPQWHIASLGHYYNYISNYVCAGMIARKIKKGIKIGDSTIKKPKDISN